MNKAFTITTIAALLFVMINHAAAETGRDHNQPMAHENHDDSAKNHNPHSESEHEGHDESEEGLKLSPQQTLLANIRVQQLYPVVMKYEVYAPGEIKANGYTSYIVSPRVDSVVLRRHAALGDYVKSGQPLVTLFSETVAEEQSLFRVASSEWGRVKQLGREAVGDKRYVSAQVGYEAALGRLLAFGLSAEAVRTLTKSPKAPGEYTLSAASSGAILSDDFRQGQRVESGEALMELADESELWVEARLPAATRLELTAETQVQVKAGNSLFAAKVTQEAHTIDPQTRTRVVRLLVNNESHHLHPGMFADVYFSFATKAPVMAVPETALMRSADGDWTVFIEHEPRQFITHKVKLGRSLGKWREIEGIETGSRVVIKGAFFVASQIAKGSFDPHDH